MIYHRYYERSSLRSTLLQGVCLSEAGKRENREKSGPSSKVYLSERKCSCFLILQLSLLENKHRPRFLFSPPRGLCLLSVWIAYHCVILKLYCARWGNRVNTTHSFRSWRRPCKSHTALNHPWAVEDIGSSLCRDTMWTPCGHCSYRMHIECYW